jgi:hypothetical protein
VLFGDAFNEEYIEALKVGIMKTGGSSNNIVRLVKC